MQSTSNNIEAARAFQKKKRLARQEELAGYWYMKDANANIAVLIAQAENTLHILRENWGFYKQFKENEFVALGKTTVSAMVLYQVIVGFYTCLETFLFRVSQEFENKLSKDQWHKELLQKMALNIPGIRDRVISETTKNQLSEILLFRHFKRYYFNFDYDWEKLDLIESKYRQVYSPLRSEIQSFIEFLRTLQEPS